MDYFENITRTLGVHSVFFYLGAIVVFVVLLDLVYNLINGIRVHLLSSRVDLKARYGHWAVVTGCTDGIGQAYTHELAKQGINIVLVSRTMQKLKDAAQEIESQYGVETKIIAVDLGEGKKSIDAVKHQLGDQEVGILINNVGSLYDYPKYLTETSESELWSMVNLNIAFTTAMTHLVLPRMKEKDRGAIVNIGSLAGYSPIPMWSIYAASKVYVQYFTEALQIECANTNITVQLVTPGLVSTKMIDFSKSVPLMSLVAPTAPQFAQIAVKTLGLTDHTSGVWLHGIQNYCRRLLPKWFLIRFTQRLMKTFRRSHLKEVRSKSTASGEAQK
uniref:Hydroxysteroid dehydrogenase-like protein 1 n=1 Tax=Cacopsylla melanoneura TaxID=428564 RepID=A0A8D9B7R5_9HEMI